MILILLIPITISIIKIINWNIDNNKIKEEIIIINNNVNIIESDLLYVDFQDLLTINDNTIGWIKVLGTDINYPIVQTNNNYYYLNHDFNNNYNKAGWIFLDYRNNLDFLSKNTIIYGHQRKDGSMFTSLNKLYSKKWQDNYENHYIKLVGLNYTYLFQIFSFYHEKVNNDYLITEYNQDFINNIVDKSLYNFHISVTDKDYILTLSTCYGNKERTIVHAKLLIKDFNNK